MMGRTPCRDASMEAVAARGAAALRRSGSTADDSSSTVRPGSDIAETRPPRRRARRARLREVRVTRWSCIGRSPCLSRGADSCVSRVSEPNRRFDSELAGQAGFFGFETLPIAGDTPHTAVADGIEAGRQARLEGDRDICAVRNGRRAGARQEATLGRRRRVRSLVDGWERTVTLGVSELQRRFDGGADGQLGRLQACSLPL